MKNHSRTCRCFTLISRCACQNLLVCFLDNLFFSSKTCFFLKYICLLNYRSHAVLNNIVVLLMLSGVCTPVRLICAERCQPLAETGKRNYRYLLTGAGGSRNRLWGRANPIISTEIPYLPLQICPCPLISRNQR